jgi:hypothetical protein
MKETPKEKAEELVLNYMPYVDWNGFNEKRALINAKQCALLAVNEIIDSHNNIQNFLFNEIGYLITRPEYWQEVKEEIEKL